MNNLLQRSYLGLTLRYKLEDGVIKTDYYKDHLVNQLPVIMKKIIINNKRKLNILDMAIGHGYTAIILAKYYQPYIRKIVAYDINHQAVKLTKYNIKLNHCLDNLLDLRIGSLYEPLRKKETFDLILSALPPIPVSGKELRKMPSVIRAHHRPESTGGATGRNLIDAMIRGAKEHLNKGGIVLTVHADFLGLKTSLIKMQNQGLKAFIVGTLMPKKLKTTQLTLSRREAIIKLGYKFTHDFEGDEQFYIGVIAGEKS